MKFEDLQALYAINAAGPLVMARHFVPLLQKGSGAFGAPNPGLYSPIRTIRLKYMFEVQVSNFVLTIQSLCSIS